MTSPRLSDDIADYIAALTASFPAIKSVWWIGSRANPQSPRKPRPDSDWDLVVFADRTTLDALRACSDLHRSDVDLLVVVDGDAYASGFGASKSGRLATWGWRPRDSRSALYESSAREWPEDEDGWTSKTQADYMLTAWRVA